MSQKKENHSLLNILPLPLCLVDYPANAFKSQGFDLNLKFQSAEFSRSLLKEKQKCPQI